MTIEQVLFELNVIRSRLADLLDEDGNRALAQAIADVENQRLARLPKKAKKKAKKRVPRPWRLEIPLGTPLRFIPTEVTQDTRHRLSLDIACRIDEPRNGEPSGEHIICVRVWTDDLDLYFREDYDSDHIWEQIDAAGGRRVMLRFHFDFANPGQPGPKHHLQIGGVQHANEFCWFPDSLRVPRFCHHPLSLLMACEFVVRTFYPHVYQEISGEATWQGAIATAQGTYLSPYYALQGVNPAPALTASLLDKLWNAEGNG